MWCVAPLVMNEGNSLEQGYNRPTGCSAEMTPHATFTFTLPQTVGTCLDYSQGNQIMTYLQQLYYAKQYFLHIETVNRPGNRKILTGKSSNMEKHKNQVHSFDPLLYFDHKQLFRSISITKANKSALPQKLRYGGALASTTFIQPKS